jgi:hypothetical protein
MAGSESRFFVCGWSGESLGSQIRRTPSLEGRTLDRKARELILLWLTEAQRQRPFWGYVAELLLVAAQSGDDRRRRFERMRRRTKSGGFNHWEGKQCP